MVGQTTDAQILLTENQDKRKSLIGQRKAIVLERQMMCQRLNIDFSVSFSFVLFSGELYIECLYCYFIYVFVQNIAKFKKNENVFKKGLWIDGDIYILD